MDLDTYHHPSGKNRLAAVGRDRVDRIPHTPSYVGSIGWPSRVMQLRVPVKITTTTDIIFPGLKSPTYCVRKANGNPINGQWPAQLRRTRADGDISIFQFSRPACKRNEGGSNESMEGGAPSSSELQLKDTQGRCSRVGKPNDCLRVLSWKQQRH